MPFSSASCEEWCGSWRGLEEPFVIFGFLEEPFGDLVSMEAEAFRFAAAVLGGILNWVVHDARVRVIVGVRN